MCDVVIYTDGGCRGNGQAENVGGYGIVMMVNTRSGLHKKEFREGFKNVTNNKMELLAVIKSLEKLKFECNVKLYTDSKYVCDAIMKNWIGGWIKNGWKTKKKGPVANKELWKRLVPLLEKHKVEFIWVKGHAENEYNNRCDKLANIAMSEVL